MGKYAAFLLFVLTAASNAVLGAETVFVTAKSAVVYAQPNSAGVKIGTLPQGAALQVIQQEAKWYRVRAVKEGTEGWISKIFTGPKASLSRNDAGAGMSDLTAVATRTRASAYTTSAAATRGLASDNVRERENLAFSEYDFTADSWVRTFLYSDEEIADFARSEGLEL